MSRVTYEWMWGEERFIEQTDCYTYLGISMNMNCKYQDARENVKNKASKAMYAILKYCQGGDVPISVAMELYNRMLLPILTYGGELWMMVDSLKTLYNKGVDKVFADNSRTSIPGEKISLQYARNILGVHKKTSNLAVRGELGLYPLYVNCIIQMCKYWHRVVMFPKNSLIGAAYTEQVNLLNKNSYCWLNCVLRYLKNYNLDCCLAQPEFFDIEYLKEKIRSEYDTYWKDMLYNDNNKCNGNKLRTYRHFKNDFKFEPYLCNIKIQQHRHDLTKFRTSAHKLNIETGRYCRPPIPLENRTCNFCKNNLVEDEYHVFFCDLYSDLRDICGLKKVENVEEFYELMSDGVDAKTLGFYIHMCFNRRRDSM